MAYIKKAMWPIFLIIVLFMFFASSFTVFAGEITGVEELVPNRPELVILGYEIIAGELVSEEQVTLQFAFQNTSSTENIMNLSVGFGTSENGFYSIFGETNSAFISTMAPGEIVYISKKFNISAHTPQVYELLVQTQYIDDSNTTYSDNNYLYLPVFGPNSFQIQVDMQISAYEGEPVSINGFCRNAGLIDLSELIMRIETEQNGEIITLQEYELGTLAADEQLTINEAYTFAQAGATQDITFSFIFFDIEGNQFSLQGETYSVAVLSVPEDADLTQDDNSGFLLMLSLVMVVVLTIIIFISIRRKILSNR